MYYKNKYMIGIYSLLEEGEQLLALVDNVSQFAKLMNITINNAKTIIYKLFSKKSNYIIYCGKIRTVEFIEV